MTENKIFDLINIIKYKSSWCREMQYEAVCLINDGFNKVNDKVNFMNTDNPKYNIAIMKDKYDEADEISVVVIEFDPATNYEDKLYSYTYEIKIYELYEYICNNIPELLHKFNNHDLFDTYYKYQISNIIIESNKLIINDNFIIDIDCSSTNVHNNRMKFYNKFNEISFIFNDADKNKVINAINNYLPLTLLNDDKPYTILDLINSIDCDCDHELFTVLARLKTISPSSRCYSFGYCSIDDDSLTVHGYINNLSSGYRSTTFKLNKYESLNDNVDSFKWFATHDVYKYLSAADAEAKSFAEFYKNYKSSGTMD